jgi:hypothetical protein
MMECARRDWRRKVDGKKVMLRSGITLNASNCGIYAVSATFSLLIVLRGL